MQFSGIYLKIMQFSGKLWTKKRSILSKLWAQGSLCWSKLRVGPADQILDPPVEKEKLV